MSYPLCAMAKNDCKEERDADDRALETAESIQ